MSAAAAWTDERVQTLTRLWLDGQSASQTARALAGGVTRNAVIGKVHRLGLSGRAKPSTPGARPLRAARSRHRPPRAAPAPDHRGAAGRASARGWDRHHPNRAARPVPLAVR